VALYLDGSHRIASYTVISIGSANATLGYSCQSRSCSDSRLGYSPCEQNRDSSVSAKN
jgi:hypothetical protein